MRPVTLRPLDNRANPQICTLSNDFVSVGEFIHNHRALADPNARFRIVF